MSNYRLGNHEHVVPLSLWISEDNKTLTVRKGAGFDAWLANTYPHTQEDQDGDSANLLRHVSDWLKEMP
jgi:hypothetical protein